MSIVPGFFCLVACVAAGASLTAVVEHFNGWQAAGYAVVAGLFIACVTVMINMMMSSLAEQ